MPTKQSHEDEVTQLAVRMYARDAERDADLRARVAALEEVDVPPEYLERAEAEIVRKEEAAAKRRLVIQGCLALVALTFIVNVANALRPPSAPLTESFASGSSQRWTFERSTGTIAEASLDGGLAKIEVRRFGVNPTPPLAGRHWATLRSITGPKDLRTLKELSFRARGVGLQRVRLRFVRGNDSWATPPVLLDGAWTTYRFSLDRLERFRDNGRRSKIVGNGAERVAGQVNELQVQTGSFVNPVDATGVVEVDDITIR